MWCKVCTPEFWCNCLVNVPHFLDCGSGSQPLQPVYICNFQPVYDSTLISIIATSCFTCDNCLTANNHTRHYFLDTDHRWDRYSRLHCRQMWVCFPSILNSYNYEYYCMARDLCVSNKSLALVCGLYSYLGTHMLLG